MTDDIIVVTGGFDPVHSGHVAYIQDAFSYGRVVVGVNSDEWLIRKKGQAFMPFSERLAIMSNIKNVMTAIGFDDSDGSACDAITKVKSMFPNQKIVFANGGDRTKSNIPEMDRFKDDPRVEFKFGIGGENKANSSSWILKAWREPIKTLKPWGYYTVLEETNSNVKVKKLHVNPGGTLSLQRHFKRSEYWFVASGTAFLETVTADGNLKITQHEKHDHIHIPLTSWHRLFNPLDQPVEIIEIQYGSDCIEEDIERKI